MNSYDLLMINFVVNLNQERIIILKETFQQVMFTWCGLSF